MASEKGKLKMKYTTRTQELGTD